MYSTKIDREVTRRSEVSHTPVASYRDLDKGYSLLIKDAYEKYTHMGRVFTVFHILTVGETVDEIKYCENSSREVVCVPNTPNL